MTARVESAAERICWDVADAPSDRGLIVETAKPATGEPLNGSGRAARLVRTVEIEIIPRLVLARRAAPALVPTTGSDAGRPNPDDVAEFAGLVLAPDASAASAYVEAVRARGVSVETLYLDLLAPAARRLGELWTADALHFAEVTIGVCRLQQLLHDLSPGSLHTGDVQNHGRRALLVPVPSDQHSFGLVMVAEFFRRAGWDVWSGAPTSRDLARLVSREWFAVVGLSASCDARLDELAAAIRAVRRVSRNRGIGVLVGGPVFVEHPELAPLIGADATAGDGRQAVSQAQSLLALMPR